MRIGNRFTFDLEVLEGHASTASDVWDRHDWQGDMVEICEVLSDRTALISLSSGGHEGKWWVKHEYVKLMMANSVNIKWRR